MTAKTATIPLGQAVARPPHPNTRYQACGGAARGPRRRRASDEFNPFHAARERHRRIDVALRHVMAQPVGNQRHADHDQEAQRQHDDGGVRR